MVRLLATTLPIITLLLSPWAPSSASSEDTYSTYFQTYVDRLNTSLSTTTTAETNASASSVGIDLSDSALVIVDMQNDFVAEFQYPDSVFSPCSTLFGNSSCFGAPEGQEVARIIASILQTTSADNQGWGMVLASQDDHARDHCSFSNPAYHAADDDDEEARNMATQCSQTLSQCGMGCAGTDFVRNVSQGNAMVKGWFPAHCVRGSPGALLYRPIREALGQYTGGPKHVVTKGE